MHVKATIYRASWNSHECPTRDLSIPGVVPYLSDENKIAPTQISSLYAFLTLAPSFDVHSAPCYLPFCALYETPGCTYRLIHVEKGSKWYENFWILWEHLSKNLQSRRRKETFSKIMECQNIEWSSTRRESSNILQYSNYIQDWPQKIMESETGLIFQASTPKSKMKPYMILKSTEAIAAQSAFPRRATVLFRRDSHYIRYNSCVWRRWWRWYRRWSSGPAKLAISPCGLNLYFNQRNLD